MTGPRIVLMPRGSQGPPPEFALLADGSNEVIPGLAVQARTVNLSTADLRNLFSSPFVLVPAPGPGRAVVPVAIAYWYNITTPFSANSVGADYAALAAALPIDPSTISDGIGVYVDNYSGAIAAVEDTPLLLFASQSMSGGPIVTASVGVGGAGYAPGDTGEIVTPNPIGTNATYTVLTVDGGGAVLTFSVDTPGEGFEVAPGVGTTVTTGGGDGAFTVDVAAIQAGVAPIFQITTLYRILSV